MFTGPPLSVFRPGREVAALKAASGRVRELGRPRLCCGFIFGVCRSFRRAGEAWGGTGVEGSDCSEPDKSSLVSLGGLKHANPGTAAAAAAASDRSSSERLYAEDSFGIRIPSAESSEIVFTGY